MAKAQTSPGFRGLILYLGSGAGPITYTAPCAFSQQALELDKDVTEETIPDCDDPGLPGTKESFVEAKGLRVSGEGLMAEQSVDAWDLAYESATPIPIRIDVVKASGAIIRRECLAHVTSLSYNRASDKAQVRISASLASHGEVTRSLVAAPAA